MARGLFTPITYIRRQVYTELAKLAWSGEDLSKIDDIPYKVIDGEVAKYRGTVFHERAIVEARTRYALGLDKSMEYQSERLSSVVEEAAVNTCIIKEPLVNVISFACEACEDKKHFVTNRCRKCIAHPCMVVCPVNAISMGKDSAVIDKEKCIDCGKCREACPYSAIVKQVRPCKQACGADAIESDELGRAKINYDKCVSCGMCIVNCPFAAITDKSNIFQLIMAIKNGETIHGIIAPSFVGQFGPLATPGKIIKGIKQLGFSEIIEAAYGADVAAKHEAEIFSTLVPEKQPFLATSCCPSWTLTVKKFFPELAEFVSESSSPMVETAKAIRKRSSEGKIVFIGPCVSKKVEALEENVKPYIDFVITFEELAALFVSAEIDIAEIEEDILVSDASTIGRNFAFATGVATAVKESAALLNGCDVINTFNANGISECRKMLAMAKAGKYDGYILEGMGCPGGCVGGAGTLLETNKAKKEVEKFAKDSPYKTVYDNPTV